MAADGRSWISTLLGGTVLAVAGFGVGMLAGGLWESPDLVFHYLLGNTEEAARIAQDSPAPRDEAIAVAAAPPAIRAQEAGAIAKPEVATEPKLPAVSARAPTPPPKPVAGVRMAVQVGAFAESRTAEELAARLRSKGYPVYLSPGADSGDARWRVRVGPIASKKEATRTAARLKAEEKLPTWVLKEDG